jgi:hypothetical protein
VPGFVAFYSAADLGESTNSFTPPDVLGFVENEEVRIFKLIFSSLIIYHDRFSATDNQNSPGNQRVWLWQKLGQPH